MTDRRDLESIAGELNETYDKFIIAEGNALEEVISENGNASIDGRVLEKLAYGRVSKELRDKYYCLRSEYDGRIASSIEESHKAAAAAHKANEEYAKEHTALTKLDRILTEREGAGE